MKKPELTATSVEKFLIEKFDSVSDLMQLSEGEESRAFSFDVGGRGYVLRVNSCADGFYKDRYVYRHFASAALPIPEVLDIGEFSESLTYCISRRAQGVTLQDLPETELPAVLQPVAEAMDAIAAADLSQTSGFGPFGPQGIGQYTTWRDFICAIADPHVYHWQTVMDDTVRTQRNSKVNAGTIPLGKLSDIDKIGTQTEIFPFLGGSGPYYSFPGDYGISRDLPESCEMKQVQMVGRHGERYPTVSKAKSIMTTWYKLSNYTGQFSGALSFLNDDYEFFIRDTKNLEMETTLANSVNVLNPYTGEMNAKRHARDFLAQYGYMVENQTSFAVFTSNSNRCHDTAQYFIDGLGDKFNISLQTISEAESAGANTLSAHHSCPAWDDDVNDDILKKYDTKYLSGIAKRLNKENKGLNLTSSDANTFFAWCAYEINARGYSDICNIFTKDELVRFSYGQDLETYYQTGPGYDVVRSVGANLFNASVKLLKESEVQDQKVWLSFTHDTDILNYLTTIGIIDDKNNLTAEHVPFMENTFHRSWYVPQGARVYTEKFQCSNDTYVRYVINDAVVPIETCSTGPGFSCEINDFYDYAEKRVAGTDFLKVCNVSSVSNSTELTFFWDWNTKHYNDTLLKQ